MDKIALLGGTFNPIHNGHLRMALEIYEKCSLSQIHFVPSSIPPHKSTQGLLDFDIRVELLKLAFKEYHLEEIFSLSLHEQKMTGSSYTYNSLQAWQEIHKQRPYFIVGLEDFVKLDTWYRWQELPKHTHFIIVKRSSFTNEDFHAKIKEFWGKEAEKQEEDTYLIYTNTIKYIEIPRLDISSTSIRKAMCEGKDARFLLPESVRNYCTHKSIIDVWSR